MDEPSQEIILCSECFSDEGLRIGASFLGTGNGEACPNCAKEGGYKLNKGQAEQLAHQFFKLGSRLRVPYGSAPLIVSNATHGTDVQLASWSGNDLPLLEEKLGASFFFYGPRLWMVGEVEPLKALQKIDSRSAIIERIITEYPSITLTPGQKIYRLRRDPADAESPLQYDSPPDSCLSDGRLESPEFPVFYGSFDVETCIHECRVTVLDETYLATVTPTKELRFLNLIHLLREDGTSEFESLDMAVHMLFSAANHAYPITRLIAKRAQEVGFDGIIYPSFFGPARTGSEPFPTVMGISLRIIPEYQQYVYQATVPNIAIFGHPIADGRITLSCANRVVLHRVEYRYVLGPVGVTPKPDEDGNIPSEYRDEGHLDPHARLRRKLRTTVEMYEEGIPKASDD